MHTFTVILIISAFWFCSANNERFHEWAEKHRIELPSDINPYMHMLQNWQDNDRIIKEMNGRNLTYTLGHNQFSGMSSEEFRTLMNPLFGKSEVVDVEKSLEVGALPTSVDWRDHDAVTGVKNQQSCGSCWAFSTTGALEGAYAIKTGKLVSFSEQQLVDCDYIKNGGTSLGCSGGDMGSAMKWIGKNNGLCTEDSYPYVSGDTQVNGACQHACVNVAGSDIISVVNVAPNSESAMMGALAKQPISVAIQANQPAFQLYKSGIFTGSCGTNLDHGVLLVGYASDYWIMKNSWSDTWGESGYMRMGRGNYNQGSGQCGVLMQGVFPTV